MGRLAVFETGSTTACRLAQWGISELTLLYNSTGLQQRQTCDYAKSLLVAISMYLHLITFFPCRPPLKRQDVSYHLKLIVERWRPAL